MKVGMKDTQQLARFLNYKRPKLTVTDTSGKRSQRSWGCPLTHWKGIVAQHHIAGMMQPDQDLCVWWGGGGSTPQIWDGASDAAQSEG